MVTPNAPDPLSRSQDCCQRAEAVRLKAIEKRRRAAAAIAWAQVMVRDAAETCRAARAMSKSLHARQPADKLHPDDH